MAASSKTKQFLERLESIGNDDGSSESPFSFGIQASINDRISRYGTAVTIGIFMGAAISAGTILGGLTWYAVSRNILKDVMKDVTGFLNVTLGIEGDGSDNNNDGDTTGEKNGRSDIVVDNVKDNKQNVLPIVLSSKKQKLIQQMEHRINQLEKKVTLLETKLSESI
jgi:hypothetical protein